MTYLMEKMAGMKSYLSFILHMTALILLFIMSLNGIDTSNPITVVLFSYMGGRTAQKVSAHYNASKDPNADTAKVIQDMDDK